MYSRERGANKEKLFSKYEKAPRLMQTRQKSCDMQVTITLSKHDKRAREKERDRSHHGTQPRQQKEATEEGARQGGRLMLQQRGINPHQPQERKNESVYVSAHWMLDSKNAPAAARVQVAVGFHSWQHAVSSGDAQS
eukprot:m.79529 g.79529  ORF g.79529 m.79529 type:complete len:137 (+) comp10812_c0_seq2:34-444(+)